MNDSKAFIELGEYPAKDFEDMMKDMPREVVILEGKTYVDADVYDKLKKERDELKNTCGKMHDIHDMYAKVQEARIEKLEKERDKLKEDVNTARASKQIAENEANTIIEDLKNRCKDLVKRYDELYDEKEDLKKANAELKEVIKFKDMRHDVLCRESKIICDENVEIERERNDLKKKNETLIKELGERDHKLEVLRVSYNAVKAKCDELNDHDDEYIAMCEDLRKENERLRIERDNYLEELNATRLIIKTVELIFGGKII